MSSEIVFTHHDLDGVTCAILLKKVFPNIEIVKNTYATINNNFLKHIHYSKKKYDKIFIADISLNEDIHIQELIHKNNKIITFIDHHPLRYNFHITDTYHNLNKSGSLLTLEYLIKKYNFEFSKEIKKLVVYANDYDLWKHKYVLSKVINRLFYFYAFDKFFKRFQNGFNGLSSEELDYIKKNHAYIQKKLIETEYSKVSDNVIFVTASEFIDELAEHYYQNIKGVDTVFVLNTKNNNLSIRGTHPAIHYGQFAELFGGGGHEKASGIKTTGYAQIEKIINDFLELHEKSN